VKALWNAAFGHFAMGGWHFATFGPVAGGAAL
jgi:hypothetical protein